MPHGGHGVKFNCMVGNILLLLQTWTINSICPGVPDEVGRAVAEDPPGVAEAEGGREAAAAAERQERRVRLDRVVQHSVLLTMLQYSTIEQVLQIV